MSKVDNSNVLPCVHIEPGDKDCTLWVGLLYERTGTLLPLTPLFWPIASKWPFIIIHHIQELAHCDLVLLELWAEMLMGRHTLGPDLTFDITKMAD